MVFTTPEGRTSGSSKASDPGLGGEDETQSQAEEQRAPEVPVLASRASSRFTNMGVECISLCICICVHKRVYINIYAYVYIEGKSCTYYE